MADSDMDKDTDENTDKGTDKDTDNANETNKTRSKARTKTQTKTQTKTLKEHQDREKDTETLCACLCVSACHCVCVQQPHTCVSQSVKDISTFFTSDTTIWDCTSLKGSSKWIPASQGAADFTSSSSNVTPDHGNPGIPFHVEYYPFAWLFHYHYFPFLNDYYFLIYSLMHYI